MTTHSRLTCVAVAVIAAMPSLAPAQSSTPPIRWSGGSAQSADFNFARDTTIAHGGRASVRVHADDQPTSFANVSATIPAKAYAGHTIRFSVFLRTAALGGGGGNLWARADATNQPNVAFGTTQQTPVRGTTEWTQVSLSLAIPQNAAVLYIGVLSHGTGSLWIDDARLEADGGVATMDFGFENPTDFWTPPARPGVVSLREAPRAISPRGLANLTAFTNALGYVRFFHPSAEALGVNWDAFAVHGIRAVESAPTPDSLASALRTVFAPIAPSVAFVRTGAAVRTTVPKPADATHVVFWRHEGVGVPTGGAIGGNPAQNIYHSERVIVPIGDVGREIPVRGALNGAPIISRPHVPDPSRPLVVALDGGVTISVPVAMYTAYGVVPEFLQTPHAASVEERFTPNDRATRLAAVALSWSLFENFYPYFDVVHTDWPGALTAALQTAATDVDGKAFQATLDRLVAALHDGHGRVGSSMNMTGAPDVQFGWAEGRVFVTAVGDSAAAKGVRRGDEVLAVDGRRPDSLLAEASTRISGATPQWVRTRALGVLLAGDPGSFVQARLRASDGTVRDVRLLRAGAPSLTDGRPDKVADLTPGTMYVDLGRISDSDFTAALPRLEKARAIIFDMRGYPSRVNTPSILAHLTDTVIHSAHFDVPLLTMPDHRDGGYVDGAWTLAPIAPRLRAHVVFLTGGGAISYAESTLGVVEAYKLGELVGEPSAGTNGNVNPFMLPGGFTVSWTGMLVQKRDGTPHHGVGVVPTVAVSPTVAGLRAGRDEVLERAISIVTPRPATP